MENKEKNIRCKRKICLQAIFGKKRKMKIKLKFMIVNVHLSITEIEMEWKLSRNVIFDGGWEEGKFRGLSLNSNKRMDKN